MHACPAPFLAFSHSSVSTLHTEKQSLLNATLKSQPEITLYLRSANRANAYSREKYIAIIIIHTNNTLR
jgi:hypothetical protein